MRFHLSVCWLALGLLALTRVNGQGVAAPATWTRVASPTSQDLNAIVVASSGSYVAVGNNGAVIESADGINWTAETSGTAENLYGVTLGTTTGGAPLLVAVGAAGTIVTSPDGHVWTSRPSGTTADLKGVAFGGGGSEFMAVGVGGTAVVSPDGINWSVDSLNTTEDLNAIVALVPNLDTPAGFVAAGASGTLILDENGFGIRPVVTGTNLDLTVLVVYEFGAIALGKGGISGGLGFEGEFEIPEWTPSSPSITGDYTAGASLDMNGTWYEADVTSAGAVMPLAATSNPTAQLPSGVQYDGMALGSVAVVVGQGGAIWTNAAVGGGTGAAPPAITGDSATGVQFLDQTITLQVPQTSGATYQWLLNGNPIVGAVGPSLTLPNLQFSSMGTYSVAVTTSSTAALSSAAINVKPIADFSPHLVDPDFVSQIAEAPNLMAVLANGTVVVDGNELLAANGAVATTVDFAQAQQVIAQPDGKWLDVGQADGAFAIKRFNPDGTLDTSFGVNSALLNYGNMLALLPNGQFVLFSEVPAQHSVTWLRLNSDGSVDPSFAAQSIPVQDFDAIASSAVDAQGRIYVAVLTASQSVTEPEPSLVFRLNASQMLDPGFVVPPGTFAGLSISQLEAVPGGVLYAASGSGPSVLLGLLSTTGAPNPGYATQTFSGFSAGAVCALQPDGTAVVLVPSFSSISAVCYNLERFTALGQVDASYGGRVVGDPSAGLNNSPTSTTAWGILPLPNGQLLLSGTFQFHSLNLVPTEYLARITPDTEYFTTRLVNASVRGSVAPAHPLQMDGYVNGDAAQAGGTAGFLFRAAGPALAAFDVPNALPAPELTLSTGQAMLGSNAGWSTGNSAGAVANLTMAVGAFPFAAGSQDAALVGQISPGPYYVQIASASGSGIVLGEAYDTDPPPASTASLRITNFSCLGATTPGTGQLTLGFVVAGPDVKSFLIRAVGPGLSAVNVTGPGILSNPILTLYQGENAIASNENMETAINGLELFYDSNEVGAFPFPLQSPDSALLVSLPAGAYTAVASGADGASGTVLLELYEVP